MGYELGSVTTFKQDRKECLCIINGEFEEDKMQSVLDRFIIKYVCCSKCKLPEIVLKIEDSKIKGDCKSCGNNNLLDNKHRMASYIVKSASTNDTKRKKGNKGGKGGDTDTAAQLLTAKRRVRKERVFSDPSVKLFREKLAEKNYPLDAKDETIVGLLTAFSEVFHKNRKAEGATKKKNIKKAYRNLKVLKIPLDKQILYGYLIFNTLFTKNIANQIDKEGSILKDMFEVHLNYVSEVTETLRCNTK